MLQGLVTGIGSWPGKDTQAALDSIFKYMGQAPHWPQLPQKGKNEGFVDQFLNPLRKSGLLKMDGANPVFATQDPNWETKLADFQILASEAAKGLEDALEEFALTPEFGEGFYAFLDYCQSRDLSQVEYLKGHLSGPLTIGFFIKDEAGNPACQSPVLRDLLVKSLGLNGYWQAKTLAKLGKKVLIFADEPALGILAASDLTVQKADLLEDLNGVCQLVQKAGAKIGFHSCDVMDWNILLESKADVINLDAYRFGISLFPCWEALQKFFQRGGFLAWGIIPTGEEAWNESADSLLYLLQTLWDELEAKGLNKKEIIAHSMLTPACGVGLLKPDLAEYIYQTAQEIGRKIAQL